MGNYPFYNKETQSFEWKGNYNSIALHVLQQRNKTEINSRPPRKFSHAGRMKAVDLIEIVYKKG